MRAHAQFDTSDYVPLDPSPSDIAAIVEILSSLKENERIALTRHYGDFEPAHKAIRGTGLTLDQFRDLRNAVRGRFFARHRRLLQ